jgi:hypothetical protein
MQDLQGGGLWKFILRFWPLREEKKLEESNELLLNGKTNLVNLKYVNDNLLKNSFYVTKDDYIDYENENYDEPILLFFTGMGKTKKIIHKFFENLLLCKSFHLYHEIYSLDQMSIFSLNECVQEAIHLYEYVRKKYPYRNILLVGHSLGSGIVAQILNHLSHHEKDPFLLGALLLNTAPNITFAIKPFHILEGIVKIIAKLFLINILDTEKALKVTKYPVKIIHTRGDKMFLLKIVEPLQNITSVFTKKNPIFEIKDGSHGNLTDISNEENVCKEINIFLKQI